MTPLAGKQYDVLRQRLRSYHPDVEAFVIEFAYGRILSRPHLTPKQRELLSVACLSGQVVFPQLHSHLLGTDAGWVCTDVRTQDR